MIHILEFMELSWKVNLSQSIFGWIFIFFFNKMMCWRSSICNKHLNVIFFFIFLNLESLLSHKINNHISYVTTLKEGIYINYRENQDKNYKTRLCLKIKRLTNVFLNLSVFILGWWLVSFLRLYLVNFFFGIIALKGCIVLLKTFLIYIYIYYMTFQACQIAFRFGCSSANTMNTR